MTDYKEAVSSLLYKFQQNDFVLHAIDNGGERISLVGQNNTDGRRLAVEEICSVDQSTVYLTPLLASDKAIVRLIIVLGNEKSEILADWSAPEYFCPRVEMVADEFYDQWEKG